MKHLALAAFVWCLLAAHGLYAQEKRQGGAFFPRALFDAPGPGYREQRERFAPAEASDASPSVRMLPFLQPLSAGGFVAADAPELRVRMLPFVQPLSWRFPPPRTMQRLRLAPGSPAAPGVGAIFGLRAGESPEGHKERLEFERRFEELKALLEKISAP